MALHPAGLVSTGGVSLSLMMVGVTMTVRKCRVTDMTVMMITAKAMAMIATIATMLAAINEDGHHFGFQRLWLSA